MFSENSYSHKASLQYVSHDANIYSFRFRLSLHCQLRGLAALICRIVTHHFTPAFYRLGVITGIMSYHDEEDVSKHFLLHF